jgi:hypothetical protein
VTDKDAILRQLGELSAERNFRANRSAATPEATAYHDARNLQQYEPGNRKLGKQAEHLRRAMKKTREHQAAAEAERRYQAFVNEHQAELDAMSEPRREAMTPAEFETERAQLEAETERLAPLVPDPDRPLPWDYQLALDDLQAFEVTYGPEVYAEPDEPEAGS